MINKVLFALLAAGAVNAHASLTTLNAWDGSAYAMSHGINGILFNTTTVGDQYVALGAHPYTNGVSMANDGVSTFYSTPGQINATHANWNFDFAFDVGACTTCTVWLDTSSTSGTSPNTVQLFGTGAATWDHFDLLDGGLGNSESMLFGPTAGGLTGFDPNGASVTNFTIRLMDGTALVASSSITVSVPEPTSLALAGLALAGLGFSRRRKA